ncbi:MAG TPA: hypothetical protein VEY13_05955 [Rubrobacteraceae bacterium]|jgi:hypothetical protein|nr:hypothetical protein [Rubrobacteraceae bacterium]
MCYTYRDRRKEEEARKQREEELRRRQETEARRSEKKESGDRDRVLVRS